MEENKNINEFDNLFKEAFNKAEVTPPADAWSAIQSQVGSAGAGAAGTGGGFISGLTSIKGILIAAAVATGIITTVVIATNDNDKTATETKKEVVANNNETTTQPTITDNGNTGNDDIELNIDNTADAEMPAPTNNTPKVNGSNGTDKATTPNTGNSGGDIPSTGNDISGNAGNDNEELGTNPNEARDREWHAPSNLKPLPTPRVSIVLEKSGVVCMGSFVKLSLQSDNPWPKLNNNYFWDYGDGTTGLNGAVTSHLYEKAGKYTVKVILVDKVVDERVVVVSGARAGFEAMDMGEGKFKFNNTSEGATTYKWYFGDESENDGTMDPEHQYYSENATNYKVTLIAINADGCADTFENRLVNRYTIHKEAPTAPNVFTPANGTVSGSNGINDNFTVAIDGEDLYDLVIYNADKQVVFKSNNKEKTWDGTDLSGNLCAQGIYYYILRYSYQGDEEVRQKSGTVAIIRK